VRRLGQGRYLLSGRLGIRDWETLFPVGAMSPRWETLGGFVTFLLGRQPVAGDVIHCSNLRFTVRTMHELRVEEVLVELQEEAS